MAPGECEAYTIQSTNRGASSWADRAGDLTRPGTHSPNTEPLVPTHGMRLPAALTPGTRLGILILQDRTDQSGLLRQQGIWSDQIVRLIMTGMQLL